MIAKNLGMNWYEQNNNGKKRGGQRRYSDQAILVFLQIRYLFRLKLRQSKGFINWIFEISGLQMSRLYNFKQTWQELKSSILAL